MNSRLSGIPIESRRKMAATLGLFAVLFVAIAAVAATGQGATGAPVFTAVAIVIAVLLALFAWGLLRTVSIDLAEQRLDAAIEATIRARGGSMCDCGHDHDPDEMHVTEACAHDGSGTACQHDCSTCVLASMRPSPNRTRAERAQ